MDRWFLRFFRVNVFFWLLFLLACTQPVPESRIATVSPGKITTALVASPATGQLTSTPAPRTSPQHVATPTADVPTPIFASPEVIRRGEIQDIAVSLDGRWLAVASASGLYLHDAQTLAFERALLEDIWVSGVAFAPDSRSLVVFGKGWLRLLDLSGVQLGETIQASVLKLEFTPDGKSLAGLESAFTSALLHIWDLPGWQERQVTLQARDAPRSLALGPDGESLAIGGESGWVELFDIRTTARLAVLSEWTGQAVTDLAFSPDGSLLAAAEASTNGSLRVWSVGSRKKVVEQYASGYRSIQPYVAFSADGGRLLGGFGDLALAWDRSSGQPVEALPGYASLLMDLEISPAGDLLAYATYNWPVYLLDLKREASPVVLSVPDYQAFNVVFTPGGKNVAAGLYSYAPVPEPGVPAEMARIWNAASGEVVWTWPDASAAAFHPRLTFQPEEEIIALADSWGNLRVDYLASGAGVCLPGCDCDPSDQGLKSGSCTIKLPHELSPMKLAYSPDGSLLSVWGVAGSWSASGLIDLKTGRETNWFDGGSRISFGPSGLIALGVDELNADHGIAAHWVVLYDLAEGRELRRVEIPAAGVAALSPDGALLAVGLSSYEMTNSTGQDPPDPAQNGLIVWDLSCWCQVAYFPVPYGITRLAFSPQGDFLVASSEMGQIVRWKISPKH